MAARLTPTLKSLISRLAVLVKPRRVEAELDQDLDEELRRHLEFLAEENLRRGMSPAEAQRAAQLSFGGVEQVKESYREQRGLPVTEQLLHDFRFGLRILLKNPAFTAVAVLSLALGIGANLAIFQLLDAVRLRTLSVENPQQLAEVKIADRSKAYGSGSGHHPMLTNAMWEQIRDHQAGFQGIFAWSDDTLNLARGGELHNAQALWVSGDFFNVLGIKPILGRVFTAGDDQRGCGTSSGVVISYSFWQRQYAGEAGAIGRKLTLEGQPFDIIGVTPASFYGVEPGKNFDLAAPICAEPIVKGESSGLDSHSYWWLDVIGRLKPGWSLGQAKAQVEAISPGLFKETLPTDFTTDRVETYLKYRLTALPAATGVSSLRTQYENPIWVLLALAGLVLLIACANIANLMLARASAREREIAVRLALGASRSRIIRQLLAESLLLAAIGAALGGLVAHGLSRFLVSFLSTQGNPLFIDFPLDCRVFTFVTGLALTTCVLFGLAPALKATRTTPGVVLKAGSRGMTAGRERFGLRRALVVSQVALSLVLLVGALLFSRSLSNLLTMDAGFQQEGILVTNLDLTRLKLPKDRRLTFQQELLSRVRAIPGVEGAANSLIVPATGSPWNQRIMFGPEQKGVSNYDEVSPGYFNTMGIPILAGRDFSDHDTLKSLPVAIVNESFTRKFFNGANPIGQRFHLLVSKGTPDPTYEVVGLVKDTKFDDLRKDYLPLLFVPDLQNPTPYETASFLVRSNKPLTGLTAAIKQTLADVSPEITIDFQVLQTQIREGLIRERLMATLSGFFGLLAGLLAIIGLYGVMSYMVTQRRNEIGIRMALGADRGKIISMIMSEAGILLAAGLLAGTILALFAARTADSMLFGLKPHDPVTYAIAIGVLAAVGVIAGFLPARRAAGVDPMVALRTE